jgi:hypothetical protein
LPETTIEIKENFAARLLKVLRTLAYIIVGVMAFAVFYSDNATVQTGNSEKSYITCADKRIFTFAQIGINASLYNPYSTSLLSNDNNLVNNACGASGSSTFTLSYNSRSVGNNPFGDAAVIFFIGFAIIEVCYRGLAYLFGVKLQKAWYL